MRILVMSKVEHFALLLFTKLKWIRYNALQQREAKHFLKMYEADHGKTDPKLIARCDAYAKEILGSRIYAPWLYVYAALAGEFKEGWIPDNYYEQHVVPYIQGEYGKISLLKPLSQSLFHSHMFPDIGYYLNGLFFGRDFEVIPESQVEAYLFSQSDKIVYKTDENGFQGFGVSFYRRENFNLRIFREKGNGVFQLYIRQHAFFNEIMPDSVATLRMTTVVDRSGEITVRACGLRVARASEQMVTCDTELGVVVDIETGELASDVFGYYYNRMKAHPDTGFVFGGKVLPAYQKCVDAIIQLHRVVPHVRCIGWDLTVDENEEVKIMEWNGYHNDLVFLEAMQGPCFADLGWNRLHLRKQQPDMAF